MLPYEGILGGHAYRALGRFMRAYRIPGDDAKASYSLVMAPPNM